MVSKVSKVKFLMHRLFFSKSIGSFHNEKILSTIGHVWATLIIFYVFTGNIYCVFVFFKARNQIIRNQDDDNLFLI